MGAPLLEVQDSDLSGSHLGRYVIERELGRGSMGIVYKAYDPVIERPVAIKRLKLDFASNEFASFRERFLLEAKSAGGLNHPSIVTIYDVGEVGGIAYIAMEYLEGRDLKHILSESSPYSFRQIAEIVLKIAEALEYAHANGVIHRDIKPANILIVRDTIPKVLDFGIARLPTGTRDHAGTLVGSPRYMSPEQIENKTLDGRSDIYSLGTVMYEMLAGRAPFNGETLASMVYKVLHEMPPPPQLYSRNTPHFLAKIVAKALAKSPADRYQDAAALASDIRRYTLKAQAKLTMGRRKTSADAFPNLVPLTSSGPRADSPDLTKTVPIELSIPASQPLRRNWILLCALGTLVVVVGGVVFMARERLFMTKAHPPLHATVSAPRSPVDESQAFSGALSATPKPALADAKPTVPDSELDHPSRELAPPAPVIKAKIKHRAAGTDTMPTPAQPVSPLAKGVIHLAISPWGEVLVDGARVGISPPLTQLQLTVGHHVIEVRNVGTDPYRTELDVDASQARKIKYKFE